MGNKSDRLLIEPNIILNEKNNFSLAYPSFSVKPYKLAKAIDRFIRNHEYHLKNLSAFGITFIITHTHLTYKNRMTFSNFPEVIPIDPKNKKRYIFIEYHPIRHIHPYDLETINAITHADQKSIKDLIDPIIRDQLLKICGLDGKYQALFQ